MIRRDRERESAADELADDGEPDARGGSGRHSTPLVRDGEDALRPPGHPAEHHCVGGNRCDGGAHHPVDRDQGEVEGDVDDAATPVITQLNCVRRARPIPIASTM